MRSNTASATANWMALFRGLATLERAPLVADPFAEHFVSLPYRALLKLSRRFSSLPPAVSWVIDRIAAGRVEQIAMRTRAIDDAIVAAIDAGIEQVVVLGAGLDARAYRMPALRSVRVAELDHPATQRYKRAQLERTHTRHNVRFVPVDFERNGLSDALSEAQFSQELPTLFVWEGVVMYLSRAAFEATVEALAAFAADGSRLLVTYVAPTHEGVVSTAAERWLLSAIGEPYQQFYAPEALRQALAERGFVVTEDTGGEDWSQRYQRNREHIDVERLANAVRVGNARPSAR